jgi:type VI secretion system protein ImpK
MASQPPIPDDPFAAADVGQTFVRPTPGQRTVVGAQPNVQARGPGGSMGGGDYVADMALDLGGADAGLNPLVAAAHPLLTLIAQIQSTSHVRDTAALKESLAQGLRDFESRARGKGIAPERVLAARYILCTALDEAAALTPWGGSGQWARHNLLVTFHNEAYGGEKVFQLMAKLAEDAKANRDLLELIYAVINLGFEGRYRVVDGGRAQMEAVRSRLAQILKTARGDYAPPLAQHWQVQPPKKRRAFLSWLPLWVTAAVAALLLVGAYAGFSYSLGQRSDPVYGDIQGLRLTPPVPTATAPAPQPRLAQFLQADIKAGLVEVRDEVDRSVVTVRGEGLFAGGSASLVPERETLMRRIADALAKVPGAVLVTGHTDSQAVRSVRFPSNWHLSQERANSVRDLLVVGGVTADRVRAEGRADSEPVAPNDTPANRGLNRRVEVLLFAARNDAARGLPAAPAAAASQPAVRRP